MSNLSIGAIVHFWPKQEIAPLPREEDFHQNKIPPLSRADNPTNNNKQSRDPSPYDPLAAMIVGIWSDNEVNLTVFGSTGIPFPATHVPLLDGPTTPADKDKDQDPDQDPRPTGYYCQWPDGAFKSRPGFIDDDTRGADSAMQTQKTVAEDSLADQPNKNSRKPRDPEFGAKGGLAGDASKRHYPKADGADPHASHS